MPGNYPVIPGKHPRDITIDELVRLPTINVVPRPVHTFVAGGGISWDVGLSGNTWVKCWTPGQRFGGPKPLDGAGVCPHIADMAEGLSPADRGTSR